MLKLDLSVDNGGPIDLDADRGLMELIQRQVNLWKQWWATTFDKDPSLAARQVSSKKAGFITEPWAALAVRLPDAAKEAAAGQAVQIMAPKPEPVVFSSPLGIALRHVGGRFGGDLMKSVHLRYLRPDEVNLNSLSQSPRGLRALAEFYVQLSVASEDPVNASSNNELLEQVKLVAEEWNATKGLWAAEWDGVKQNSSDENARVSELIGKVTSKLLDMDRMSIEAGAKFEEDRVNFATRAEVAIQGVRTEFSQMKKSYETELKINSAVKLWQDRTSEFQTAAKAAMHWARCIAGGGVICAVVWVLVSYLFAGWLFDGALEKPSPPESGGSSLNPIFHFQLIFTSVSAVFYVTIFLWVMRLMIKNYLTNEHLRIDAMSRSSMAETYIALIKDGGATAEADRAIVLTSLFRPVADGLVKDDGPPLISLPALLAGVAQGRNG